MNFNMKNFKFHTIKILAYFFLKLGYFFKFLKNQCDKAELYLISLSVKYM